MKKYVLTSYIPNTEINADFVQCLNNFCKVNNAELQVLQCKHNYNSDAEQPLEMAIREEFGDTIKTTSYNLSRHLHVSDFRISINTIDPISGMESMVAKHTNVVLPFPRHRFKTVPRMLKESHTPRAIWCTGTISEATTYKNNKSGNRMKDYHVLGALYVEIQDSGRFSIRQIQFDGKGFFELDKYYTSNEVKHFQPSAMVLGDTHVPFQDPKVMAATKQYLHALKPKYLVRHDDLDCCSITHHTEGKYLTKAQINMTLEQELKMTSDNFKEYEDEFPFLTQLAVASNHPQHLDRYIDEARYKEDSFNHILGLELALAKAKGSDLYDYSMNKYNKLRRTRFLKEKDSVKIAGVEIADHGHSGANGSRGNVREKGIVYSGKVITGHTHSPEVGVFGNFVTGTSTYLSLHYTSDAGSSSWLNTHVLLYPNGKMTHIHIIPE